MCGIYGYAGFDDPLLLAKMQKELHHRGPDDHGTFTSEKVGLGHTRLSIIDLSPRGRQPLGNEDGSVQIICNGEIYNYQEIQRALSHHRFSSDSDTEVIVHGYEEHGEGILEHLRGMFAFALYDAENHTITLARDPIGKKPLYYYLFDGRIIFASEIKALLACFSTLGIEKSVDPDALCVFLRNQYIPGEKTLFSGIRKLLPGHMMTFDIQTGKTTIRWYWHLREGEYEYDSHVATAAVRTLLEESVRLRQIADVPVGSFLSGGIDSSAITALALRTADEPFHTFNAAFSPYFSESKYATMVAETLGTEHHTLQIDAADVLKEIDTITWHFDEPLADAAVIANYFLSREAKRHVTVVLAGEGADELFGGYSSYVAAERYGLWYRLPVMVRRILRLGLNAMPFSGNPELNASLQYAQYFAFETLSDAQQHTWTLTGLSDAEMSRLGRPACKHASNDYLQPPPFQDRLNALLAMDCLNHLPELYLMKADKATMAHSIEERVPPLDLHLIEYAFRIPGSMKIAGGVEKWIWKEVVRDLLPKEVVERKKQGFGVPYQRWVESELYDAVASEIDGNEFLRAVFPKMKPIPSRKKMKQGRNAMHFWNLYALGRWGEVFEAEEE